jgi:hypothetical protein
LASSRTSNSCLLDSRRTRGFTTIRGWTRQTIWGSSSSRSTAPESTVWEEFNPVSPFECQFLDDTYNRLFRSELRTNRVFQVFSGLAIFIGCLGLVGLALFTAERRTKEIGIRKVLGASPRRIAVLISSQMKSWYGEYLCLSKYGRELFENGHF